MAIGYILGGIGLVAAVGFAFHSASRHHSGDGKSPLPPVDDPGINANEPPPSEMDPRMSGDVSFGDLTVSRGGNVIAVVPGDESAESEPYPGDMP